MKTKHNKAKESQHKALKFLAEYPDEKRVLLSDSAVKLVRKERREK